MDNRLDFLSSILRIPASPILGGVGLLARAFGDKGTSQYMSDLLNAKGWDPFAGFEQPSLPMRDDIRTFPQLNQYRQQGGLDPVTQDYYSKTYLPYEYQFPGTPGGALSDEQTRMLRGNPYLRDLYLPKGYF